MENLAPQPPCELPNETEMGEEVTSTAASSDAPAATRHDGWTGARRRVFLERLAECGVVSKAARAVGMNARSAYNLRAREEGRSFRVAWDAALSLARARLSDRLMVRAMEGQYEEVYRDGQLVGRRHRFDNRLALAMLDRLEAKVGFHSELDLAKVASREFGAFLNLVERGEPAGRFIVDRLGAREDSSETLLRLDEENGEAGPDGDGENENA